MSLDPPTYLHSLQNNIRARPIPWEGAVRAGTITDQDLRRIKAIDKVRKEHRRQTVEANFADYVSLLLGGQNSKSVLEAAAKRQDVVQYMLVLSGDLLADVPDFGQHLQEHADPYRPFIPLLNLSTGDDPIPLLTSSVLSALISEGEKKNPKSNARTDEALSKLFKYLSELTQRQDNGLQEIAVQEYSTVLRTKRSRELFWAHRKETLNSLVDILRAAISVDKNSDPALWSGASSNARSLGNGLGEGVGVQLLYHVLLVIWQLSFEASLVGEGLQQEYEIIPLYTQLIRLSPKEKTTRLLLSTMLNLLGPNKDVLLPAAVSAHLPPLLETLKGRHLTDEDLLEDLKTLTDMFDEYTNSRTTFDEYSSEVLAGHLRWSPPHRSPTFWTENASRILSENKAELPKKLAEILGKPWEDDKQVLAIACNDIGWLVKTCPERRDHLEKLGLKVRVMELMADSNESVRWESLRAVGEWLRYSFEG